MNLFYDLEIKNAIPDKKGNRKFGVKYCDGWTDYAGMGIACLCFITDKGYARVFGDGNLKEAQALMNRAEALISYNGIGFDNKVMEANGLIIPAARCVDLCALLHEQTGRRFKLADLCEANFGKTKTGEGGLAPERWQEGDYIGVIDYCLCDVTLTAKLYEKIWLTGQLFDPYNKGQKINVDLGGRKVAA